MVAASDITYELNENVCFTFYVKVGEIHENENLLYGAEIGKLLAYIWVQWLSSYPSDSQFTVKVASPLAGIIILQYSI